jgi:Na+/melibiose symporter-like transporter
MNFKAMDEQTKQRLMAYLYGELTEEESLAIAEELKENEALRATLESLRDTKSALGSLEAETVSTPPFFQLLKEEKKNSNQAFKWVGSIAAAILLLLLVGRFTGFTVNSNEQGVQLSFSRQNTALNNDDYVAKADVDQMIQSSLAAYDAKLNQQLDNRAEKQETFINDQFDTNRTFLASSVQSIENTNKNMLKNYWEQSNQQQQTYMTSLMGDFTNYVEQRRSEDMQYMMAKINLLETDNDLLELETNQLKNTYALNTDNNTY